MAEPENKREEQPWRPVPDPTELTTAALYREVNSLKELMEQRFSANDRELLLAKNVVETRFDGMDRALKLLQDISDRFPERIDEKIGALKQIHGERFESIQVQFSERDTKVAETALNTKTAVDAALAAAEKARSSEAEFATKAADKAESGFAESLRQQRAQSETTTSGLRDQISDLKEIILTDVKERITRLEAETLGRQGQKQESHQSSALVISIVSVLFAVLMGLLAASAYIRPLK